MAQTIQASDVGPDVAYYLGSNPREAERISRLSPYLQAKEIGERMDRSENAIHLLLSRALKRLSEELNPQGP